MTDKALERYPGSKILYCGGVMSNSLIQKWMSAEYNCHFAPRRFSCDNAIGIAYLAKRKHQLSEGK
ncbi:hypothetical protein SDC9_197571 [bioreactor metagenome]|uniref:Gcp-like domain-containing protein n=1 Tax=bioreactor metagenome TaxID=1076179 RepID=A0A645IF80_9ZZZZ